MSETHKFLLVADTATTRERARIVALLRQENAGDQFGDHAYALARLIDTIESGMAGMPFTKAHEVEHRKGPLIMTETEADRYASRFEPVARSKPAQPRR